MGWNTSTTNESSNSASTTTKNLSNSQNLANSLLSTYLSSSLTDPSAGLTGLKTTARNSVNDNYSGATQNLADSLLSYGGTSSGKFGTALRKMQSSRAGTLSNVNSQYDQFALNRQNTAASLAEALLGMNFGSTTNASSSGTSTTDSSAFSLASLLGGIGSLAGVGGSLWKSLLGNASGTGSGVYSGNGIYLGE